MSKNHEIIISNAATALLINALSNAKPGWAKELSDVAVASKLLVGTFAAFKVKYIKKTVQDEKNNDIDVDVVDPVWAKKTAKWQLSEREREKCKFCLTALAGSLPVGAPILELITTFGLEEV